jgi:hypothetical protein
VIFNLVPEHLTGQKDYRVIFRGTIADLQGNTQHKAGVPNKNKNKKKTLPAVQHLLISAQY